MKSMNLNSKIASLCHFGYICFLSSFFIVFIFRSEVIYILDQVVESTEVKVNTTPWDEGLSEEVEIEKKQTFMADIFIGRTKVHKSMNEKILITLIAYESDRLPVYLEVQSPPPRS